MSEAYDFPWYFSVLGVPHRVTLALGVLRWQNLLPSPLPGMCYSFKSILISVGRGLYIGLKFEQPFLHPIKVSYNRYLFRVNWHLLNNYCMPYALLAAFILLWQNFL